MKGSIRTREERRYAKLGLFLRNFKRIEKGQDRILAYEIFNIANNSGVFEYKCRSIKYTFKKTYETRLPYTIPRNGSYHYDRKTFENEIYSIVQRERELIKHQFISSREAWRILGGENVFGNYSTDFASCIDILCKAVNVYVFPHEWKETFNEAHCECAYYHHLLFWKPLILKAKKRLLDKNYPMFFTERAKHGRKIKAFIKYFTKLRNERRIY